MRRSDAGQTDLFALSELGELLRIETSADFDAPASCTLDAVRYFGWHSWRRDCEISGACMVRT